MTIKICNTEHKSFHFMYFLYEYNNIEKKYIKLIIAELSKWYYDMIKILGVNLK